MLKIDCERLLGSVLIALAAIAWSGSAADDIYSQTKRLPLPAIEVDTAMTEADLAERVTEAFGL